MPETVKDPDHELIRKLMAVEVMKWAVHCRNTAFYVPKEDVNKLMENFHIIEGWKPTTDMNQAMQCADAVDFFPCITKTPMGWTVICDANIYIVVDEVHEVPLALCVGIARKLGLNLERENGPEKHKRAS